MKKTILSCILIGFAILLNAQTSYRFLVGTFTVNTPSEGIYNSIFNSQSGKAELKCLSHDVSNPSFLAFSADSNFVYAVNETGEKSKISAFRFDRKSKTLTKINDVDACGADPCFISVSCKHVITANYADGSICVFSRNADGSLTNMIQKIQHIGKSINTNRQSAPHAHQCIFSPDGRFLLVNDLGTDFLTVYRYNSENNNNSVLIPYDSLKTKVGGGPRHLAFSTSGKIIYLLHELDGTLSTLSFDKGILRLIAETTVATKPGEIIGASDIHLSPDGKFVYAANRGSVNNISCFKIEKNQKLTLIQQISVGGIMPRNFMITHDGKFIFAGNQKSNYITVFRRNQKTGKITDTLQKIEVGAPVCLLEY